MGSYSEKIKVRPQVSFSTVVNVVLIIVVVLLAYITDSSFELPLFIVLLCGIVMYAMFSEYMAYKFVRRELGKVSGGITKEDYKYVSAILYDCYEVQKSYRYDRRKFISLVREGSGRYCATIEQNDGRHCYYWGIVNGKVKSL